MHADCQPAIHAFVVFYESLDMSTLGKSLESVEKKEKQPAQQQFIHNVSSVAESGGEACTPASRHT